MHWLWLACRIAPDLWDDETWHELATRQLQLARDAGALSVLPLAATYRAGVHVHAGEFAAAAALIEEADAITEATGNAPLRYTSLVLAAWRGREAEALDADRGQPPRTRPDGARAGRSRWPSTRPRCSTTASAATARRSPPRSAPASTTTWVSSAGR